MKRFLLAISAVLLASCADQNQNGTSSTGATSSASDVGTVPSGVGTGAGATGAATAGVGHGGR